MAYPDYIDPIEREIIDHVLAQAFKSGLTVSVFDGEDWPVKTSTDHAEITASIATTDETMLRLRNSARKIEGDVFLVHGNGSDVIADHTANPAMAILLASAFRLADQIELREAS